MRIKLRHIHDNLGSDFSLTLQPVMMFLRTPFDFA